MDTLDAFTAQALAIQHTVDGITAQQWAGPGLGVWTVAELIVHIARGAHEITQYLDRTTNADQAVCDRFDYFDFDMPGNAESVAQGSQNAAAGLDPMTLPAMFASQTAEVAELVRDRPGAELLPTWRGPVRLDEYLATRVLELTVHHLDLTRALDLPAATTDAGLATTEGILVGMLGGDRPEHMDPTTFVLAATGRDPCPDPRFPVLC